MHFYNGRGMAEQWIKEGKYALNWTRLSCHRFVANQVRLLSKILTRAVYPGLQLGELLEAAGGIKDWSLRSAQVRLIKMGGRMVRHARRLVFQLAEVAVPRALRQYRHGVPGSAGSHRQVISGTWLPVLAGQAREGRGLLHGP